MSYAQIMPGDPAPYFKQRSGSNPKFMFDTVAGRYVVLCFLGTAGDEDAQRTVARVLARKDVFNDDHAALFLVSVDAADEGENRLAEFIPGFRVFWDFDASVSRLYGAVPKGEISDSVSYRRQWVIIDPTLRVVAVIPLVSDGSDVDQLAETVARLPPAGRHVGFDVPPPILVLPNVFEPDLCRHLIGLYEAHGGEESGFMREVNGKTVAAHDPSHKRRRDYIIEDDGLIKQLQHRVIRRVVPEIAKVHQFNVTRMERYIVCCYAAEDGGHFRAHRDNTTKGTAHRRFAVSINLNNDFEGGEISFPEYGPRRFKPPVGGAVVFSCSLLHAVSQVTAGRRFAFLPFLYDEAAAKLREANKGFLAGSEGDYKA